MIKYYRKTLIWVSYIHQSKKYILQEQILEHYLAVGNMLYTYCLIQKELK